MRVPPTSPTNLAERHVQLSEFVDVSVHSMTDTQMSTIIEPSVHGRRMEHILRTAEISAAPVPAPRPAPVETPSRCVNAYKRVCDTAYLVCGALALPALGLAAVNPLLLVVPAGLLVTSVVCYCLRGKPTPEMEQEYAMRRVSAQANDSQGA